MATTIEKVGARVYAVNSPFAAKDRLKRLGCHWDGDRRQWWIGAAKAEELHRLVAEINGVPEAIPAGLRGDTPAGIVADKLDDVDRHDAADAVRARMNAPQPKAQEDPDTIRLTGKGRYKGREYYAGAVTRDGQKVRLLTLPDANGKFLDFWAPVAEVEQTKRYTPQTRWNGSYGRGRREVEVHQTLGSIARFVARQRRQEADGVHSACGRRDCRRLTGEWCSDCHDAE